MTMGDLTLEPLQSAEKIFQDMVNIYVDEIGFVSLHDVYKVLLPIKPDEIGIQLFSVIEDVNENEMLQNGRCPSCATELVNRYIAVTREDPAESYLECPKCHDDYVGKMKEESK
jgi:hypothetical protein